MPNRKISTTIRLDGAEEFKRNINAVNSALKLSQAEFKNLTASYNESSKSAASLSQQQKALEEQVKLNTSKTALLKDRVDAASNAYDNAKQQLDEVIEAHGRESDEAIKAANAVAHAENELNKYKTQLLTAETALMKSQAALKDFNDENGKTKIGQTFTAGRAAVSEFEEKLKPATNAIRTISAGLETVARGAGEVATEAAKISFKAAETSAKAFTATVSTGMNTAYNAVGTYTKALAGTAATVAGAAAAGAAALTKSAVESYSQYEQLAGGVDTLFKDSADKVKNYADNAYKSAGMNANEYLENVTAFSASLLQSMGNDTNAAADKADMAIKDMSDNVNKFGVSMENVHSAYKGLAKGNFSMLDNLSLGYGGNKAEMERLLADAEAISGIHYDISSFSDMIDAIHVIQTSMGITGATAAEASSTIEGSVKAMKSAYDNLITGIANDNADFDTLINNFVASVADAAKNILPRVKIALNGVMSLIRAMIPIAAKEIPDLIGDIIPDLISVSTKMVIELTNQIVNGMPIYTSKILPAAVKEITKLLPSMLTELIVGFNKILLGIADTIIAFLPVVSSILLPKLIDGTTSLVLKMIDRLSKLLPELATGAQALFMGLIDGLNTVMDKLIPMLPELVTDLSGQLISNIPVFFDSSLEFFEKIIDALAQMSAVLMPKLPELITNMCDTLIAHIDEIMDAGFELLIGLADGLIACIPTLLQKIPEIIAGLTETFTNTDNLQKLLDTGITLVEELANGLPQAITAIVANVGLVIGSIIEAFMSEDWGQIGKDILDGILSGFLDMDFEMDEYLGDFADNWVTGIKDIFGIHSPSRLMRDEVGKNLALGIGEGFRSTMIKEAEEMTKAIPRNFDTNVNLDTATGFRLGAAANTNNYTYNVPVNVTFTGNIDQNTDTRKLAEDLATEAQYELIARGLHK